MYSDLCRSVSAAAGQREAPNVSAILTEVAELRQRGRSSPDPAESAPATSWRHQQPTTGSPGPEEAVRPVPSWRHQTREAAPSSSDSHRPTAAHQRTSPLSHEAPSPSSTWLNTERRSPISEEARVSPHWCRPERDSPPGAESSRPVSSWTSTQGTPAAPVASTPLSEVSATAEQPAEKVLVVQEEIEIRPPPRPSPLVEPLRQKRDEAPPSVSSHRQPPPVPPHGELHRPAPPPPHAEEPRQAPPVPPHATHPEPARASDLHWTELSRPSPEPTREPTRLTSDSPWLETARHSAEPLPTVREIHVEREQPSHHSPAAEKTITRDIPVQHEKSSHLSTVPERITRRDIPVHREKTPRHSSVPERSRVRREEDVTWHKTTSGLSPPEGSGVRSAAQREKQQVRHRWRHLPKVPYQHDQHLDWLHTR